MSPDRGPRSGVGRGGRARQAHGVRPDHPPHPQPAGLVLVWLAPVAWVAGTALQLLQTDVAPVRTHALTLIAAVLVLAAAGWGRGQWLSGQRSAVPGWLVVGLAVMVLAWAVTGWRAAARLSEAVPADWSGRDLAVCVRIDGLPTPSAWGMRVEAVLLGVGDPTCSGRRAGAAALPVRGVQMLVPARAGMARLVPGDVWLVSARLRPLDALSNPGAGDALIASFAREVRAVLTVRPAARAPERLHVASGWDEGWVNRLRLRVREAIAAAVPHAGNAGVLAGLAVGDQSAIERSDWAVFRDTGVAHVVAISGTHVVLCGALMAWLVRRLWGRVAWLTRCGAAPEVARWVGVGGATCYAVLAGWGLPAQRTVGMLFIAAVLRSRARRWPWALVCLWAAAGVLALEPWAWRQPGFWLSFVAVAVLMHDGRLARLTAMRPAQVSPASHPAIAPIGLGRALAGRARELIRLQWLVTLALAPVTLLCFQQMSVVGLLANLLAIPVFTLLITPFALAGIVWPGFWVWGAACIDLMRVWLMELASWPMAVWSSPALPVWVGVLAVLGALVAMLPLNWRARALLLPLCLPLVWLPPAWRLVPPPSRGQFHVIAMDVGQGSAVLVRTARHALLFDAGPAWGPAANAGERVVVPVLRALGVARLDALVLSHEDADHAGGAQAVLSVMPATFLVHGLPPGHALLAGGGSAARPCVAGQSWQWDGVDFSVLHPGAPRTAEPSPGRRTEGNGWSCVLKVSTADTPGREGASLLLTGDIGTREETEILARSATVGAGKTPLHSDVLVVAHHGSGGSTSAPFLDAVSPRQAVIQVGARNPHGHPSPAVLERLLARGVTVHATPSCGAWLWLAGEPTGRCWRETAYRYWFARAVAD